MKVINYRPVMGHQHIEALFDVEVEKMGGYQIRFIKQMKGKHGTWIAFQSKKDENSDKFVEMEGFADPEVNKQFKQKILQALNAFLEETGPGSPPEDNQQTEMF